MTYFHSSCQLGLTFKTLHRDARVRGAQFLADQLILYELRGLIMPPDFWTVHRLCTDLESILLFTIEKGNLN